MIVRAGEPGVRVLLGQQDCGRAEPAADIGYPGSSSPELVLHAVKRRDPGQGQVGDVAGAEELLAADEDVLVVLVPAHPAAGAERLGNPRLGLQHAEREHERPGNVHAAVRVRERERLLLGHRVRVGRRVVVHVSMLGRLAAQPFGDVPGIRAGPLSQFGGGGRVTSQRPVQAEVVSGDHAACREGSAQVGDEPAEELLQLVHVDSHDEPPCA